MIMNVHKEELSQRLQDIAIFQGDAMYRERQSTYMKIGQPEAIFMVETDADIQDVLRLIRDWNSKKNNTEQVAVSVRSGGHGMSGSSTNEGGIIIDLAKMNQVEIIDEKKQLVRVQAGANWGKVAQTIAPFDLAISSGNFGDVGVGGLASSGGIGYFIRSQGLTIDHIAAATLITAQGERIQVTEEATPELYWGIRGGGSQLGIITEFIFKAHRLDSPAKNASVIFQEVVYTTENLPTFVEKWGNWMRHAPRALTSFLMIQKTRTNAFTIRATNVWDGTDTAVATPYLEQALPLEKVLDQQAVILPYPSIIPYPKSSHDGQQRIQIRNVLVDNVDYVLGKAIEQSLQTPGAVVVELRFIAGALADTPTGASAWAHRTQEGFVDLWMMPINEETQDQAFSPIGQLGTGAYGAYSSDTRKSVAALAWPDSTGNRLRKLRYTLDPSDLFNQGLHV